MIYIRMKKELPAEAVVTKEPVPVQAG
jgi:hypothetical protein